MTFDPIRAVEKAYDLTSDTETWLSALCGEFKTFLGGEPIHTAYLFERCMGEGVGVRHLVAPGLSSEAHSALYALNANTPPSMADAVLSPGRAPLRTLSEQFNDFGIPPDKALEMAPSLPFLGEGVFDIKGLFSHDGLRSGIVITTAVKGLQNTHKRDRKIGSLVATHIGAGLRLRNRLEGAVIEQATVEAIFDPGGHCRHAVDDAREEDAQEHLRRAVHDIDTARRGLRRREPIEALELWRGLVDGQWSLVETFDSDGSRFFVAHRNTLELPDPRALTQREKQIARYVALGFSNKRIAYTLGLSQSAVSKHLSRILRKLQIPSPEVLSLLAAPDHNPAVEARRFDVGGEEFGSVKVSPGSLSEDGRLTAAERDVAEQALRGLSHREIAEARDCSERTVANHFAAIFRKLGVTSRREMVLALSGKHTD